MKDPNSENGNGTISHPLVTSEHLKHGVVVYIRQSSQRQVEENKGSAEFQKSQREIALAYGWREEQIIEIDDDLGQSGKSIEHRLGYQRMLDLLATGKVKAIIAADASRLSRNLSDFLKLLTLAARQRAVLILDRRPVNPLDHSDIFVSRILGTVAEYENGIRTRTMVRARIAKAQKGEIVIPLPVGFKKLDDGTVIKDPEVKDVIELVIQTFWQARSLLGTVRKLRAKEIELPRKRAKGRIEWREATTMGVRGILLNPANAGIFAYGRSEAIEPDPEEREPHLEEAKVDRKKVTKRPRRRPVPRDRWIQFLNRLPGYLTPEEQDEVRKILQQNAFGKTERPGKGSALLQGIVTCGNCGQKLTVSYGGK
jgi:DNA invertase Pin-like site-specific DNA recombinase